MFIPYVVMFECSCCTVVRRFWLFVCLGLVFGFRVCLYVLTCQVFVCCLFCLPYACPVLFFGWTNVVCRCFPFGKHDVCIFNLPTIDTSFVSLFFLQYCLKFYVAQLFIRSLWLFVIWILFIVFVLVCMILHVKYLFVVCCL